MKVYEFQCPHCRAIVEPDYKEYFDTENRKNMYVFAWKFISGKAEVTNTIASPSCRLIISFFGHIDFNIVYSEFTGKTETSKCPYCKQTVKPDDTVGTLFEDDCCLNLRNEKIEYRTWCLKCEERITFKGSVKWSKIL